MFEKVWANAAALTAAAVLLASVYAGFALHYYNRGWAAHEAEIAAEIKQINEAREALSATLTAERLAHGARTAEAAEKAIDATRAYCSENPSACGIEVKATSGKSAWSTTVVKPGPSFCGQRCTLPAPALQYLNTIH